MSVRVVLRGGLGNNFFQYALGRIIAERLGLALRCVADRRRQPGDRGPRTTLIDELVHFPNVRLRMPGRVAFWPRQTFDVRKPGWNGQDIDLQALLGDRRRRRILLCGYVQRFEYFAADVERIRRWYEVEPVPLPFSIDPDDVVVNLRRGIDYAQRGWLLPLSYYGEVLDSMPRRSRVYVCGREIDAEARNYLAPYEPQYFNGTPIADFCFMMRFRRIVLSNSSFAWWAAFLSAAEEIYAARTPGATAYRFSGFRRVDLHMREARYREITVPDR